MKVFVLGATGMNGKEIVRLLATLDVIDNVVAASRSLAKAKILADELGNKIIPVAIDACDENKLANLLSDCDLLINAGGPFNTTAVPALRAAIKSGSHYCDLNESGHVAQQLLQLDAEAKDAGIKAIIGIGMTPGLTNLLAKQAASQFDQINSIYIHFICCASALGNPEQHIQLIEQQDYVNASVESLLELTASLLPNNYLDHPETDVPLTLSNGISLEACQVAFSESVTLPLSLNIKEGVAVYFSCPPDAAHQIYKQQAGRIASGEISARQAVKGFFQGLANTQKEMLVAPEGVPTFNYYAVAKGVKEGRQAMVICSLNIKAICTAESVVTAGIDLLSNRIKETGVFTPESIYNPLEFFQRLNFLKKTKFKDDNLLTESLVWLE